MKIIKKSVVICAIVTTIILSACGGNTTVTQGESNPDPFTVDDIKDSPANYVGTITLIGIVYDSSTQDFALQNESGTFEVLVDYRGSQALPQLGDKISVEGQLRENRPCCGPGFTLTSTRFEAVDN